MTTGELLLENFELEMKGTRTTLERVPVDKPDFKPHGKSMALGRLSMHVATLPLFGFYILTEPGMDMANSKLPKSVLVFKDTADLVRNLDENVGKVRQALSTISDEELDKTWKFSFGETVISNRSRAASYVSLFLNHLIHHRAQVGVYLRLLDIPVPGLYGPSADEPFGS